MGLIRKVRHIRSRYLLGNTEGPGSVQVILRDRRAFIYHPRKGGDLVLSGAPTSLLDNLRRNGDDFDLDDFLNSLKRKGYESHSFMFPYHLGPAVVIYPEMREVGVRFTHRRVPKETRSHVDELRHMHRYNITRVTGRGVGL